MFEVGDKVQCVNLDLPCGCPASPTYAAYMPILGRYYTVAEVGDGRCIAHWPIISAPSIRTPETVLGFSWPCTMFRKVEGSAEDIFKLAKAPTELEPA